MKSFPVLQAILDVDTATRAGWAPGDLAAAFLDGGARFLQIRAKQLASGPFLELCDLVVRLGQRYGATVIVNDRVDLALMSGAAGVHVGQDDLPPADARALLGPSAIVGYSTHTREQVAVAMRQPVTYLAVGPVFGTRTKDTGYESAGLDLVGAAVPIARECPIVAIGGITLERAGDVLAAGATTLAVISDLLRGGDPSARVADYLRLRG